MWSKLLSAIHKIDIPSFIFEEKCRHCGRIIDTSHDGGSPFDGTPGAGLIYARFNKGPPRATLCTNCYGQLMRNRRSIWWLPLLRHDLPEIADSARRRTLPMPELMSKADTADGALRLLPISTAGMYEGPLQKLIRRLKYDDDRLVVTDIGPLLVQAFCNLTAVMPEFNGTGNTLIVPIPMHGRRERQRGYNQANLLAVELARYVSLPVANNVLKRAKITKPQYGLKKQQRLDNVSDAFVLSKSDIRDKAIVLVDDVFTSGATLITCASMLTAHGAACVAAIAAARAPFERDTKTDDERRS